MTVERHDDPAATGIGHGRVTAPAPGRSTPLDNFHARAGRILVPVLCILLVSVGALGLSSRKAEAVGVLTKGHLVKPGDTLSALAVRYGTTVAELVELNNLSSDGVIRVGSRLKLPSRPVAPASALPGRLAANRERLALRAHTAKWAKKNGIPVDLLEATLWLESGFNQSKVSSTGAVGVGQLMPDTSAFIARHLIGRDLNPLIVEDNIRMSARYLWWLLKMYEGDSTKALHAYYQGQGSIRANGLYTDTIQYARNVQALRKKFR
jgi:LysM repeat protein